MNEPAVILAAATAGEIQARGAAMTLDAGVAASPFGACLLARSALGICHLAFFEPLERDPAIAAMRAAWPLADVLWDDDRAGRLAARIFDPSRHSAVRWQVFVRGTPFQLRVWHELLRVPPGAPVSYGQLAAAAGMPRAARATGTALGHNPVAFLIPCHRVIRASGASGAYRWGAGRKRAILAWESGQTREYHTHWRALDESA
ncbi:MAG: methylated-DNA--[protein]-cysteine S-methyltransferase [Verrucomicrobiota bacterium]